MVVATIEVKENFVTKTVTNIPINAKDADKPVTIRPNTITVVAQIPQNLIRDTPVPAMLFRAYVNAKDVKQRRTVPVIVNGVNVPGHEPIVIKSHTPTKVEIIPQQEDLKKDDTETKEKGKS